MSIVVSTLGFPRLGPRREFKQALESYWTGKTDTDSLLDAASGLRTATWACQHAGGVTHIPSNDFSFHDHVLDITAMVGAIPTIYGWRGGPVSLETYFAMARGTGGDGPVPEMARWFDTHYHYVVPKFARGQDFELSSTKVIDEYREARAMGFRTRPVLLGPVTYLLLGKCEDGDLSPLALLPGLLPVYFAVLRRLAAEGAEWVQIDEPCLGLDLDDTARAALKITYTTLAMAEPRLRLLLTTYFGALGDNLDTTLSLPVAGLHLDLARAPEQLAAVHARAPANLVLSLGVIDGRNVWRADLHEILDRIAPTIAARGADRVMIGPSCSLLHVPLDLRLEKDLDPELTKWLAFTAQKVEELAILGTAIDRGRDAVAEALDASADAVASRRTSLGVNKRAVETRIMG